MRAFRLAYDGRPYFGFQRQPDVPTVEGTLFDALRDLSVLDAGADRPPGYAAAGRTDAGVSAAAQTVAFGCPEWCTPRAINSELPGAVRAWASADVPGTFHATHDARRRTYTYHLYAPPATVDDERARAALSHLAGEHDFHNFTPDDAGTVRTLDCSLARDGDFLVLRVAAGGFVRELVRRLVSLVHAVAAGEADLEAVERALGPASLEGPEGIPPAPPTPLVLTGVAYPGVAFTADDAAVASARTAFEDRRVDALRAARAVGGVLAELGDGDGDE